ncbi:MAG: hypothetical protein K8T26_13495 [Lentisphaerae bacterium]|nr:hypothetical protein [Lentisphaerota bacterium]
MNAKWSSATCTTAVTMLTAALCFSSAALTVRGDSILGSKHDLSAGGPGTIKATSEREVCTFCHTPHRAISDTPLWSHVLSSASYTPYGSTTAKAHPGQPTGSSKLCLSCHDGTVALGMVVNREQPIDMQGGTTTMPVGPSNLGRDLSDDHPVSFTYTPQLANDSGELEDPALLTEHVRLDHNDQLQCTACHDPHNDQYGKFLVVDNTASALCMTCHKKYFWETSTHRTSPAAWNGIGIDPWPRSDRTSVQANGCENCHTPHDAGTGPRLIRFADEETTCFVCHNGHVAEKDIQTEFDKLSIHPIEATAGIHDPTEDLVGGTRHVECVDCHNPHASNNTTASAPNASGRLAGVTGVTSSGAPAFPLVREYELCYRCHGDANNGAPARVDRQFPETNTSDEFNPANASYHPVEASGKNQDVPSMISPWSKSSLMYCTDCHNNDQGPGAGGTGPKGPHGSRFAPILERELTLVDHQPEGTSAYALCYKCHSRDSILGDKSFSKHKLHVSEEGAACTTCHDSHGVAGVTHLINFNPTYVSPSDSGRLEYIDNGRFAGACYLKCHGENHDPEEYGP